MTPTQEFARSVKTWVVCLKTIIIEELSNQGKSREKNVDLSSSLEILVIDEADLIFSFGFEADIRFILEQVPSIYQVNITHCTFIL